MSLHVLFVFQSLPFYALLLSTQKDLPRSGTVNREDPPVATTGKNKHLFHLVSTGNFSWTFQKNHKRETTLRSPQLAYLLDGLC